MGKSVSGNSVFEPGCPVEVTLRYLGASTPSLKLPTLVMLTVWPLV